MQSSLFQAVRLVCLQLEKIGKLLFVVFIHVSFETQGQSTIPKDGNWYIYPSLLAHENPKTAHKNEQKRSENFKPCVHNIVSSGNNFPKIWLSMCAYWLC